MSETGCRGGQVPERTHRFTGGLCTGQADISKGAVVHMGQNMALAMCSHGGKHERQQATGAANRLHAPGGKRCGVERGKPDLSFRAFDTLMNRICVIIMLDVISRFGLIRKLNAFEFWNQDL